MKFNPQLKNALEGYDPNPKPIEVPRDEKEKPSPTKQKVVGGDILWKPIDRTASMLIRKAPWWAHPPQVSSKPNKQPEQEAKRKTMSDYKRTIAHAAQAPGSTTEHVKSPEEFNAEMARTFVARADKSIGSTSDLLDKAMDARAAMDVMCEQWKKSWFDFIDSSNERLREIRTHRMAMDTETRQLMASLREVRSFFLEKDYQMEIERLRDFVSVCERLQKLKESGFLDTVADTMLKLADQK